MGASDRSKVLLAAAFGASLTEALTGQMQTRSNARSRLA
jgi:hypothetical protein